MKVIYGIPISSKNVSDIATVGFLPSIDYECDINALDETANRYGFKDTWELYKPTLVRHFEDYKKCEERMYDVKELDYNMRHIFVARSLRRL